jgi:hypothetical protein
MLGKVWAASLAVTVDGDVWVSTEKAGLHQQERLERQNLCFLMKYRAGNQGQAEI